MEWHNFWRVVEQVLIAFVILTFILLVISAAVSSIRDSKKDG